MGNIGPLELAIVLIIALVIFGPKRLPELGRSLGKGMREFRSTVSGLVDDDDDQRRTAPEAEAALTAGEPAEAPVKDGPAADPPPGS